MSIIVWLLFINLTSETATADSPCSVVSHHIEKGKKLKNKEKVSAEIKTINKTALALYSDYLDIAG